jgi:hypothetical protein
MVKGLDPFRERFRDFEGSFTLIGGAACDEWFTAQGLTRHFLLMTATPHNGKEEDFQLFLALLDGDRFEGKFRDGVHQVEVSDLMRRMVKEKLLKFDGRPLFPERIAYTVPYKLSDAEAQLYKEVTDYVRREFNRAEALQNDKRAGTVGFALTTAFTRFANGRSAPTMRWPTTASSRVGPNWCASLSPARNLRPNPHRKSCYKHGLTMG